MPRDSKPRRNGPGVVREKTAAESAAAVAVVQPTLSNGSLQVAYECVGLVPAKNGPQAVALANCLLEIEAMMRARSVPVPEAAPAPAAEDAGKDAPA